jgi:hypothetical protein
MKLAKPSVILQGLQIEKMNSMQFVHVSREVYFHRTKSNLVFFSLRSERKYIILVLYLGKRGCRKLHNEGLRKFCFSKVVGIATSYGLDDFY